MRSDQLGRLKTALTGRYAIERELGRGGMATVYLGEDVKHRRKVALKVFRPELAALFGPDRFLREIEVAGRLNHPHILALYDSGEIDGFLFYEMLAGEPPYTGPSAHAVTTQRLTDPVPVVGRLRAAVPAGIEQALTKALAMAPTDRFASAAAFAEALAKPVSIAPGPQSVAVLPFLSLGADAENELFADGITEDVIAHLSKIRALKVISRASVMPFKKRKQGLREIGAKLRVSTILEGSVRRVQDRVRVVAELLDVETVQHLWAETYDRQLTDIFAIQTDVALHIAAALKAELSPDERTRMRKEPTSSIEAYQLYLQGRHCLARYTQEGIRKATEYFEQAIEKDPRYALAYAGVAMAYAELGQGQGAGSLRPAEAYRRAKEAATKALELDRDLGEAHSMIALLKFVCDFDWRGAEQEFECALNLNPSSADTHDYYGRMLSAVERYDDAIAMLTRAQQLDPLSHPLEVATAFLRAGRYEEALETATRVTELDPHYALAHATLGWAYLKKGLSEQGLAELENAVRLSPEGTLFLAQLGQAYALVGTPERAREVLCQLDELSRQRYVSPYHFAYVHAGLGEQDTAIDWLERAYEERAGAVYGIKGSFLFTTLRSHPRFTALLRRMNLA